MKSSMTFNLFRSLFSLCATMLCVAVAVLCAATCLSGCSETDDFSLFGSVYGTVTDYEDGSLLENATVTLTPSSLSKRTDAAGTYKFESLDPQQYTVTIQKSGYQPNRKTVTVVAGESLQVDVQLTAIPSN